MGNRLCQTEVVPLPRRGWVAELKQAPNPVAPANVHVDIPGVVEIGPEELPPRPIDKTICTICLDRLRSCAFVPCGHVATCEQCATNLNDCPVCRMEIVMKQKLIFA